MLISASEVHPGDILEIDTFEYRVYQVVEDGQNVHVHGHFGYSRANATYEREEKVELLAVWLDSESESV